MDLSLLKSEIDSWLSDYFKDKGTYNKRVYEAMDYSVEAGGKRLRPILHCLTYELYKNEYKSVMPVGCAIEMIHTYSLIHDDLPCMDDDDLRRGHPTNHKVFGESMAVLAGDGLLNEAMSVLFKFCIDKNKNAIEACKLIADSAGAEGMLGGQVVDILSEGKKIPYETLRYMHKKKTGALIRASIVSGAILANASQSDITKLSEFGDKLGLAFQIRDDILDVAGDEKLLGKPVNSDIGNDKTTFVSTYGIEKCKEKCNTLTEDCIDILSSINENTDNLKYITKKLLSRKY